jgi:hypothetical protein
VNGLEKLSSEASRLIDEAARAGIVLRALGSVGVRLHCHSSADEMDQRERMPKDIDLVTRKRDRRELRKFLEAESYEVDRNMLVAMEGTRYLFRSPEKQIDIDVWVDVLDLCHRLDVSERMGVGPSLPIEDLILSKLQIVELTPNDINDLAAMLSSHETSRNGGDLEAIDLSYLTAVLANDWGFWRTATGNLATILPDLDQPARQRAIQILDQIEETPKGVKWKLRAKVGERIQWWQDVDIPRDTY